jgi:hypothetical protein
MAVDKDLYLHYDINTGYLNPAWRNLKEGRDAVYEEPVERIKAIDDMTIPTD